MNERQNEMVKVGTSGDFSRYRIVPAGIDGKGYLDSVASEYGRDSYTVFDENTVIQEKA